MNVGKRLMELKANGLSPRIYQFNFDRDHRRHAVAVVSSESTLSGSCLLETPLAKVITLPVQEHYTSLEKDFQFARNARAVTVVTLKNKDGNIVGFGTAITSSKDVFCKKEGIVKALGRALAST